MKIAGISFDHMHMGDLLREAHESTHAEIVGICDNNPANREAFTSAIREFSIPDDNVFSDIDECLESSKPDLVILCAKTASHAVYVEQIARPGLHILVEKPFAASVADADRMCTACEKAGSRLFINWPLAWYPSHNTAKSLLEDGVIGELCEVHYYDGNRGPTYHLADKVEVSESEALQRIKETWWYRKDSGGGSLLDYLGYGVTLGTWFHNGARPIDVTSITWAREGLEVDEHACCVVRYERGLSKFETRWGTFTDPWITQPQPKCGFVLVGTRGTISSFDYDKTISLQTSERPEIHAVPVNQLPANGCSPVEHVISVLEKDEPVHGPLRIDICRLGQEIVDAAVESARLRKTIQL